MGVTKETIERNVLKPMREYYGNTIGAINSRNVAKILGEEVYCLGAEKSNQLSKIQGATFKYLYGDEVAKWNEDVFNFMKSRLRSPVSCFDGTLNPESPNHYLYKFIFESKGLDIYTQHYTIDDNPNYPEKQKEELKKEYAGTVFYDRYILGLWKKADGLVYPVFANNTEEYLIDNPLDYLARNRPITMFYGIDWGHSKSANTGVLAAVTNGFKEVVVIDELYTKEELDPDKIYEKHLNLLKPYLSLSLPALSIYPDNAESMLIRGLKKAIINAGLRARLDGCYKHKITDRIVLENALFAAKRIKINRKCVKLIHAFNEAVWDSKSANDSRLDDGTSNIDSLDSFEYAICSIMEKLSRYGIKYK